VHSRSTFQNSSLMNGQALPPVLSLDGEMPGAQPRLYYMMHGVRTSTPVLSARFPLPLSSWRWSQQCALRPGQPNFLLLEARTSYITAAGRVQHTLCCELTGVCGMYASDREEAACFKGRPCTLAAVYVTRPGPCQVQNKTSTQISAAAYDCVQSAQV
jgi:hypothetical protein